MNSIREKGEAIKEDRVNVLVVLHKPNSLRRSAIESPQSIYLQAVLVLSFQTTYCCSYSLRFHNPYLVKSRDYVRKRRDWTPKNVRSSFSKVQSVCFWSVWATAGSVGPQGPLKPSAMWPSWDQRAVRSHRTTESELPMGVIDREQRRLKAPSRRASRFVVLATIVKLCTGRVWNFTYDLMLTNHCYDSRYGEIENCMTNFCRSLIYRVSVKSA